MNLVTNKYGDLAITGLRFRQVGRGEEPVMTIERDVHWPTWRSNPTFLVPTIVAGEMYERESEYVEHKVVEVEIQCPHCGEQPYRREGDMLRYGEVCGHRPDGVVSDYETICEVCGHAIAWHGCLGVSFCIACGGELRFFNEGSRNMYGQPVGTGGVVFP